jgi:predicted MFS family arabinose efflux permease
MAAILTDRGITPERAAIATSLVGAAVIVGRLGSGYLLDRLFAPHVAILLYGATAVGTAILSTGTAGNAAFVAAFLAGLGMGAEVESMGYMISRYFGLHAFGTAYGHAFGAFMLAGAGGVWMMGAGYDRYHSYTVPLIVLCGAMVIALGLLSRLGPYRFAPEAAVEVRLEPVDVPSGA